MPFYLFLWAPQVIAHLAEHDVTQDEFEEIVCDPGRVMISRTTGRPVAIGMTSKGRLLVCVYEHANKDAIVPVTAFEPEEE